MVIECIVCVFRRFAIGLPGRLVSGDCPEQGCIIKTEGMTLALNGRIPVFDALSARA